MRAARCFTLWAGGLVLSVSFFAGVAAANTTAEVLDWQGASAELTEVITTSFDFQVDGARVNIPVAQIKRIDSIGRGCAMVVRFLNGDSVMGTTEDRVAGNWRLGAYMLELNKARNIIFHHTIPPRWTAMVNGFEVHDLKCRFPFFGHEANRGSSTSFAGDSQTARLPVVIRGVLYFIPFSEIEHATPVSIQLAGRPASEVSSFGRSRIVEGAPAKLVGHTRAGTFEISLDDVKSIRFPRLEAVPAGPAERLRDAPARAPDCCDEKWAVIATICGDVIRVFDPGVLSTNSRGGASSGIACRVGESRRTVELPTITGIHNIVVEQDVQNAFGWKLRISAEFIAKKGPPVSAVFENPYVYFGGVSDLGYTVIRAQDVAKIDLE